MVLFAMQMVRNQWFYRQMSKTTEIQTIQSESFVQPYVNVLAWVLEA